MTKVLLILTSKSEDGDLITDGLLFDSEDEALDAAIDARAQEVALSMRFGVEPEPIKARLYLGDANTDETLVFLKEV